MIDFRYHVVSLVSVFLALAVGIVLGAGPLNEGISVGITDQVRQLTAESNQLRSDRDEANRSLAAAEDWAAAVGPAIVARQLIGRSVAVVELPGADSDQVEATVDALTSAGAVVRGRVGVQNAFSDSATLATRRSLAEDLAGRFAGLLSPTTDSDTGTDSDTVTEDLLARELAGSLLVPTGTDLDPDGSRAAQAQELLTALADAGLVDVKPLADGVDPSRSELAVLVGPADNDSDTQGTADPATAGLQSSALALAGALDEAGSGTVLAGPTAAAEDGGVLAALRSDAQLTGDVSTVDGLESPIGRVNVVLALREQLAGTAGNYGTSSSADAVSPTVAGATL